MRIARTHKPVPILSDGDLSAGATLSCDSINMKNYHHATFLVNFQDLGGAATYILLYSGATDAALTSALTFRYSLGGAAQGSASADIFTTKATSSNLSIAHATYDNYGLIIEVDASDMDVANGEEWLTLVFADTDGGATGNVSVWALLEPRYSCDLTETALA